MIEYFPGLYIYLYKPAGIGKNISLPAAPQHTLAFPADTHTMIELQSSPKVYTGWTERSCTPDETLRRIEQLVPESGITRVAEITDLDRIGIPVYSCIRPTAADGAISVYNGKGGTPAEARVAGIMEGIERYSAEAIPRDIANLSYSNIRKIETAVDPKDLILPH